VVAWRAAADTGLGPPGRHPRLRRPPDERVRGALRNERAYQLQLDAWFEKANARTHKTLRCRPVDRLLAEREQMAPLPAFPDLDRRWVARVPADPYLRFDTSDYSLDRR
jgi:hypothetical protein